MAGVKSHKARRRHGPHPTEFRKQRYSRYALRREANIRRRLERHLRNHPLDLPIKRLLESG